MRGLEVAATIVQSVGLVTLQREDLHYATASEDIPADPFLATKGGGKEMSNSSSESSEEEEGSGKEILDLLRRAKKGGQGLATSSEKPKESTKKMGSRYALLRADSEKNPTDSSGGIENMLEKIAMGGSPDVASSSINALITMELLKVLKGKKKKSKTPPLDPEESPDSSSQSDSSHGKKGGASRSEERE
eukprot:s6425_g1.t1